MGDSAPGQNEIKFVSRGGLKLQHALKAFEIEPSEWICVDLGCSTGGFTDCLLQAGAERVYSVDTAYGEFAWTLRNDERVTLLERTNALHVDIPDEVTGRGGVDLAVIDLGWTRQDKAIPAAIRWLRAGGEIVSLIKPHYEVEKSDLGDGGVLDHERAEAVAGSVADSLDSFGTVLGLTESPIVGGARSKKKRKGTGNKEWLVHLRLPE